MTTSTAECPSCGAGVKVGSRLRIGQRLRCRVCNSPLRVVWLSPLELDGMEDDLEFEDDLDEDLPWTRKKAPPRKSRINRR